MLGTSPMAITYSHSELDENNLKREQIDGNWKTIISERVIDGKLQLKQYTFPKNASTLEIQKILSLEGENGWIYARHITYQHGIVLFDKFSHIGSINDFSTKVLSTNEKLDFLDTSVSTGISYKVIFSGKMAETNVDANFVISIMNSGWKFFNWLNMPSHI